MKKKKTILIIVILFLALTCIFVFYQPNNFEYLEGNYSAISIFKKNGNHDINSFTNNSNKLYEKDEERGDLPEDVMIRCEVLDISQLEGGEINSSYLKNENQYYKFSIQEKINGKLIERELDMFNENIFFADNDNLYIKTRVFNKYVRTMKIDVAYCGQWQYSAILKISK